MERARCPTLVLAYMDWKPRSSAALHFTGTPAAQIVAFGFRYLGTPFPPESVENPHRAGLATLLVGKRRAPADRGYSCLSARGQFNVFCA